MMTTRTIHNVEDLGVVVDEVLSMLPHMDHASVIALRGDLGSGKTTFTQLLAARLGITEHVTSPTFVVMRRYPVTGHTWVHELVHIDAYRVDDEREMDVLRVHEVLDTPGTIVCIEWPERISAYIPDDAFWLTFRYLAEFEREVAFTR